MFNINLSEKILDAIGVSFKKYVKNTSHEWNMCPHEKGKALIYPKTTSLSDIFPTIPLNSSSEERISKLYFYAPLFPIWRFLQTFLCKANSKGLCFDRIFGRRLYFEEFIKGPKPSDTEEIPNEVEQSVPLNAV